MTAYLVTFAPALNIKPTRVDTDSEMQAAIVTVMQYWRNPRNDPNWIPERVYKNKGKYWYAYPTEENTKVSEKERKESPWNNYFSVIPFRELAEPENELEREAFGINREEAESIVRGGIEKGNI